MYLGQAKWEMFLSYILGKNGLTCIVGIIFTDDYEEMDFLFLSCAE